MVWAPVTPIERRYDETFRARASDSAVIWGHSWGPRANPTTEATPACPVRMTRDSSFALPASVNLDEFAGKRTLVRAWLALTVVWLASTTTPKDQDPTAPSGSYP
jgi:hypothetical protein